jgi:hypothetical protein
MDLFRHYDCGDQEINIVIHTVKFSPLNNSLDLLSTLLAVLLIFNHIKFFGLKQRQISMFLRAVEGDRSPKTTRDMKYTI